MYENRDAIYRHRYETLYNDSLHTMSPEKKTKDDKEVVNNLNQSVAGIIRTILKVTLPGVKPIVHNL